MFPFSKMYTDQPSLGHIKFNIFSRNNNNYITYVLLKKCYIFFYEYNNKKIVYKEMNLKLIYYKNKTNVRNIENNFKFYV